MSTEISDTIVKITELSGDYKFQILTATLTTADNKIVLTESANKISEIIYAQAHLTKGADADMCWLQTSWSSLDITIKSFDADGGVADEFTDTEVEILVIGK